MTTYNWNYNQLKVLKKEYLKLLFIDRTLSHDDKEGISVQINSINEMLNLLNSNYKTLFSFSKYRSIVDEYSSIPKQIRRLILNTIPTISGFKNFGGILLPKIKLSNSDLVSMCHDFFKWLPDKRYVTLFEKYTNPKNHLLKFYSSDLPAKTSLTYPLYYPTYVPYFYINREHTIQDFCSLNHEIAHGIYYRQEKSFSPARIHSYLLELEGYFFDFLSIEYLKEKKIVSATHIKELEFEEFINGLYLFLSFYVTYFAIQLYVKKKDTSIESMWKSVLKHDLSHLIKENYFDTFSEIDPVTLANYCFSYLISLDIENLYRADPEYAFSVFETIRNSNYSNPLENEHITFMEDNYQNLKKTIKKVQN